MCRNVAGTTRVVVLVLSSSNNGVLLVADEFIFRQEFFRLVSKEKTCCACADKYSSVLLRTALWIFGHVAF